MDSPEIYALDKDGQVVSNEGAKTIQWGKGHVFQQMMPGKLDVTCKRMKLDLYLTPYTKMNFKWSTAETEELKT